MLSRIRRRAREKFNGKPTENKIVQTSAGAANAGVEFLPTGATWCVDIVHSTSTGAQISGWYIRPEGATVQIIANGNRVAPTEFDRSDLASVLVAGDGNVATGFNADLGVQEGDGLLLEFAVDGTTIDRLSAWYPADSLVGPIPSGELRARVHGGDILQSFLLEGYTAYKRLDALIEDVGISAQPDSPIALLDWGCGCGRVARYFLADGRYDVSGSDIDSDNVGWCSDNLDGRYETIPTQPPTVFEPESFDVIIGVSVMTHLDLDLQREWLAHLATLLRPGGVALLTSHGWATARRTGITPAAIAELGAKGYTDVGRNPDIPEDVVEAGYYRDIFNTPEHIAEHWGPVMNVESVRPALIGQHQDVVVLRRLGK